MLNKIIAASLKNRLAICVLALLIAVVGTWTGLNLPVDVLPDLNKPTVTVMTEVHGLTPEEIEQQVTRPVEQAVNGVVGVERVRSTSGMGLSVVYIEFDWDTDIYRNRQLVQEKLQSAQGRLPEEAVPQLAPISSLLGQTQLIGVLSKGNKHTQEEVRAYADQLIRPRLLGVPGVAQVVTTGGAPRHMQIEINGDMLRSERVTLHEVARAVSRSNEAGAGGVFQQGVEGSLVSVTGRARRARDFELSAVRREDGRTVVVGDVANVKFGPAAVRTGDAGVDDGPGVIVVIKKQPGVDTVDLTHRIEAELAQLADALPADIQLLPSIFRQADFIDRAIENVGDAVRDGAWLVLFVLVLFLLDLRTTFITLTAIPLSIAVTALVFKWAGLSVNTMTLGGLAVAIGALVDDAIVDVENVFRRLRQNRERKVPRSSLQVVYRASSEVRKPILIGTLVVAAVYLPLFALPGVEGRLFRPIGVAYIVSILASLVVALTVTPVLCSLLLPNSRAVKRTKNGPVVRGLQSGAEGLIRANLRFPRLSPILLGGLSLFALGYLYTLGSNFLPAFNEGSAQVNLMLPPGSSLETSTKYGRRLQEAVRGVDGVSHVGRMTGRAEGDEHAMDVNVTEMVVTYDPESKRGRDEVLHDIRDAIAEKLPGLPTSTEQPLAHLLSHLLSGVSAQVAIKIDGPSLKVLRDTAKSVEQAIQGVPGVTDLIVEPQVYMPRIEIRPLRAELARWGLHVRHVTDVIMLALEGHEQSTILDGIYSYPVVVRLRAQDRRNLDQIRDLYLRNDEGELVRLGDVAWVGRSATPNLVNRENMTRRIVVQHNVEGRPLSAVVSDVKRALEPVRANLTPGYGIRLSGQFEAQEEASRIVFGLSFVSLLLMAMLLYGHFRSWNLAIQVLLNIPAALIGAVFLLGITGQDLSVATLVGLVALGGIASRNGILLIDHYLHLMREEGEPFGAALLVRAGRERIVPVVMTALTSGIALVPLLLSPGEPGRELLYPVATVIVGGLFSSTLLDLLLTPGVFMLFGRKAAERLTAADSAPTIDGEQTIIGAPPVL